MSDNLYALFQERFHEHLSRPFIETEQGEVFKYQDVERESARVARLLTSLGVKKGDRVAVQVDKTPQALFLYLACLRAGFIYLPLNTGYQPAELEYFLSDAQPSAVVVRPEGAETMRGLAAKQDVAHVETLDASGGGSLMDKARELEAEFDTVEVGGDELAAILYTSGTTGRPKGAMITHRNLASNALALHEYWGWREGDVLLHALPIFHVHGLFVACHCALLNVSTMLFLRRFEARKVIERLPRATVMMGVPTFYTRLLAEPDFGKEVCRNMRLFISGSAPLLEQTFHEFRERTGHTILERYGMTETGMNCSNPLDGERIAGTVGFPLPGVEVRVVDEEDKAVATGEPGNLQVRGDNVFAGYWCMPDKTAEEFTEDGFFRTGDIAAIDKHGYVSIVGRAKDMVISGGYNVYPKEIELEIDALEGVSESAVIGLPHPDYGEAVAAVVVPADGSAPTEDQIIDALHGKLAGYKIPKRVFFQDDLPRNTMGKVQKNALRQRYGDTFKA